jgi:outer membrane protein TolC
LSFINNRIRLGEEKPIDSVEAYIEFARREVLLIEAELDFKNAGIILSNHLWNENNEPLALKENTFPQTYSLTIEKISNDSLQRLLNNAKDNHPEIMAMSAKIRSIDIERKLSAELIKPQLNLEYYPFQTFTYGNRDEVNNVLTNNYKFGATFYMPILLRKERGKLEATKFKLKQSQLEFDQNQRTIINNIFTSYNEVLNLSNLVGIQNDLVRNAVLLRDAEEIRFESGESSLFLVNMRERSLIESQAKLVELRAKFAKSLSNLQWSAGSRLAN